MIQWLQLAGVSHGTARGAISTKHVVAELKMCVLISVLQSGLNSKNSNHWCLLGLEK